MKKIVIHYPFIAQYRMPIFKLLSSSKEYNYEFWADEQASDKYLLTDTKGLNFKKVQLRLLKLPLIHKQFEWQPKAIMKIFLESPDCYIILGNPNSLSNWLCALIAKIKYIPILMWSHGYLKDEKGIKNFIRKTFYKLADGHLLYGNKAKDIMLNKGFDDNHLHVIYNSLDYDTQKTYRDSLGYNDRVSTRQKFNINEEAIVLIAIGRLEKKLKINQAIETIKLEKDNGKNTVLLIVGDGYEKESLKQLALNLNVSENIIFYGACHDEKTLSELYNASDYSVVMGKVGLSAMHSLAYGIPMLTNNNLEEHFPEIEAIIENQTGNFFKENNITDLQTKLLKYDYRSFYFNSCINILESKYTPTKQKELIEIALKKILKG